MNVIILSKPEFFDGETALVNELFAQGMPRLHLRKPQASDDEMNDWLERIVPAFRPLIVVHDHHELARLYQLGGIHLNSRYPVPPEWVGVERRLRPFTVSRSCHSIAELSVGTLQSPLDYLFLSPIFDSISKPGYASAFSYEELMTAKAVGLLSSAYALGGVTLERFPEVERLGFRGAAILGDFWNHVEQYNSTLFRNVK
jgi:thiamine-phosphate pyrophosphorylase